MAISSVASVASSAANAAYARSRQADGKTQDSAKDDKAQAADASDGGSRGGGLRVVNSVVAGALGFDDPTIEKPPEKEKNGYYTAGKVLAAAGTIGTILSVLA